MYLNQKIQTRKKKKINIPDVDAVTQKAILESINQGNYVVDVHNTITLGPSSSSSSSSNSSCAKTDEDDCILVSSR